MVLQLHDKIRHKADTSCEYPMEVFAVGETEVVADEMILSYDDIEPIITDGRIMRANGFILESNGKYTLLLGRVKISYHLEKRILTISNEVQIFIDYRIPYVHEIQQVLRLFGFTEFANNFKIK